jgi:iron complex transport system ATP-binding protein
MSSAPQTEAPLSLAARDVHLALSGRPALDGASLAVGPGEIVAVVGPNGAGKSTLLRVLAGLAVPDAGSVTLDERSVAGWDRRALGRTIAYLPQDRTVHWPVSVRTLVGLGRLPHHARSAADAALDVAAIERAMLAADVAAFADRPVTELSGGERARVLLARALAQEARFLLADEPAAGLDPAHALRLFAHLGRLAGEGKGVAVALHDLSLALRFCHRVALVKDGRVMAYGPPGAVVTETNLAAAYGIAATLSRVNGLPVVVPVSPLP